MAFPFVLFYQEYIENVVGAVSAARILLYINTAGGQ